MQCKKNRNHCNSAYGVTTCMHNTHMTYASIPIKQGINS